MTEDEINEVLPSITIARLFYIYGRLDDLLNSGFEAADSDFYEMFWELLYRIPDFCSYDYDEYSGLTKWYFSFKDMMEYYRLCRAFSRLRRVKLKDNPYMRDAQQFVEYVMNFDSYYGYGWTLHTRINHQWASGIVFRIDEGFDGEFDLLEALLSIADWYKCHLDPLRKAVEEAENAVAADCMEVKVA